MSKELNTLLNAIRLADMDGAQSLTVDIEDLRLLRKTIIQRGELVEKLETTLANNLALTVKCVQAKQLRAYK